VGGGGGGQNRELRLAAGYGIITRESLPEIVDPPAGHTPLRALLRHRGFERGMSLCFIVQFIAMCAAPAHRPDAGSLELQVRPPLRAAPRIRNPPSREHM
jgi:hypothetical protein